MPSLLYSSYLTKSRTFSLAAITARNLSPNGGATANTLKFYDGADDISLANINTTANTVDWLDSSVVFDIVADTTPQLGGQLDVNGNAIGDGTNELLKFVETASAVNEITITNQATGSNPSISATGDDTNVGLEFSTKGTGAIKFNDLAYIPQQALTSSSNAPPPSPQSISSSSSAVYKRQTFSSPTNPVEGAFISLEINYDGSHLSLIHSGRGRRDTLW